MTYVPPKIRMKVSLGYRLPFLPQSSSPAVSPQPFIHSEQCQAIALSIEKGEQRLSYHSRKILVTKLRNGSHFVNSGPPWWERLSEWSRHVGRKKNVKLIRDMTCPQMQECPLTSFKDRIYLKSDYTVGLEKFWLEK